MQILEKSGGGGLWTRRNIIVASGVMGCMMIIFIVMTTLAMRQYRKRLRHQYQPSPVRKRIVIMRQNMLYTLGQMATGGYGDGTMTSPLVPHVKIEGSKGDHDSNDSVVTSLYELPIDHNWEFPREQ